jgi:hypothetical protein
MKYKNIREEELKNKVGAHWFNNFDSTEIIGNIDFSVFPKQDSLFGRTSLLWAEVKTGNFDVTTMFVQLILTIGKARTFDKTLPPAFLGAFDFKKIAFVSYISIQDIFYINDFNWNVTPSNHQTKEFKLIKERISASLSKNTNIYDFESDEKELKFFIANNIAKATEVAKIKIDKNNFIPIYLRWLEFVKPNIEVDWEDLKNANILDSDFYLADLFVDDKNTSNIEDDTTIRDNLFVIYINQGYKISKENIKQMFDATINIRNKDLYQQFWKRYKRPPVKNYQEYIIERRDLLVPQDIRERKGAFFTPRQWVELSQKYLSDYLGTNWQDDYYIWDCAAGTGNLLAGLTNKYNIYASTLDQADVKVMHERIDHGANLLKNHVFQFDFLNDDFPKLPQSLKDIINDPEKCKKLIVYINPPYAESGDSKQRMGTGKNKSNVASETLVYKKYSITYGTATRELFVQFLIRISIDIPNCIIGHFSTLKFIQSQNFEKFRSRFKAEYKSSFIVPANTFDNVKGKFPIGFYIWNLNTNTTIRPFETDIYDVNSFLGTKKINIPAKGRYLIDWLRNYYDKSGSSLGFLRVNGPDVQNNLGVFVTLSPTLNDIKKHFIYNITANNLKFISIYYAVRKSIKASWINDREQFLHPNIGWKNDYEFHNDCLTFLLFDNSNNVRSADGTNNWIPFTEQEVNAQEKFQSNFMTQFINAKLSQKEETILFDITTEQNQPLDFSEQARAVFGAGLELWRFYHEQPNIKPNASYYDIKEYFQGRNDKGRMNTSSKVEDYIPLITELRSKMNILAEKLKPKIYEYGFLND